MTPEYTVYLTKGELSTLMGFEQFGAMITWLEQNAPNIKTAFDYTNTIAVDNPEVIMLMLILKNYGIITEEVQSKITALIDERTKRTPVQFAVI